eukprot:CAMPEP_0118678628 /NCGR_PEP_ID=MMETSP0800-20121206/3329_1 /TAXON_ID=210618 ORGANISM="Striatella unipunctata, Strain CCMP2910" /NCGR_SAMPLE_ID=MMETSP0800 /ASSEMBLY_ACC=CAM_ASM_000638 /LENGTH=95 /DNA_ID=CAMNT_0006574515 /DNA_START=134 /DNA_END=421 /DNA_ORIENTATION=-
MEREAYEFSSLEQPYKRHSPNPMEKFTEEDNSQSRLNKRQTTADSITQNISNIDQQFDILEEQNFESHTTTTTNNPDMSNDQSSSDSSQASQDTP